MMKKLIFIFISIVLFSCKEDNIKKNDSATRQEKTDPKNWIFKKPAYKLSPFYIKGILDSSERDIKSPALLLNDSKTWKTIRYIYIKRHFEPIWGVNQGDNNFINQFLSVFDTIHFDGLDYNRYSHKQIKHLLKHKPKTSIQKSKHEAALDIALTSAFVKLANSLRYGELSHTDSSFSWQNFQERQIPPDSILKMLLESKDIIPVIEQLRPKHYQYHKMRELLKYYLSIKSNQNWNIIPFGLPLGKGSNSERVAQLRKNLMAAGFLDLPQDSLQYNIFDEVLEKALVAYQKKFSIKATGVAGPITLKEMNQTNNSKIAKVKMNMERLRWLPDSLGDKHIWVNIPEFWLKAIENGKTVLQMKVIVGKILRQTPVFSENLQHIVFSPFWNVPHNLAVNDILPKLQHNPQYLDRMRFEVFKGWGPNESPIDPSKIDWEAYNAENFPFRLRQKPGPWNAMGSIKFIMPNQFQIYLHDTPSQSLFKKQNRYFSSGCIRIEKPLELAKLLLPEFTEDEINAKINQQEETYVRLKEPVPVHIVYFTTWVNEDGTVTSQKDIYNEDGKILK